MVTALAAITMMHCLAPGNGNHFVDRRGEPALRKLLDRYSHSRGFYVWINEFYKNPGSTEFYLLRRQEVWFGGKKRIRVHWDSLLTICDGKIVLSDMLNQEIGVSLLELPIFWAKRPTLILPLIVHMTDGTPAFDDIVNKDKSISSVTDGRKETITYTSKSGEDVRLELVDGWMTASEEMHEGTEDKVIDAFGTKTQYLLFDPNPKLVDSLFDTTPPKGLPVYDERKSKGGSVAMARR